MKRLIILSACVLTVCGVLQAPAATLPGSSGDDFLTVADAHRWSVGINYESINRRIALDGGTQLDLEATSASLFIGYDALEWLTVFGTFGQTENTSDYVMSGASSREFKWSLGANANLVKWHLGQPRVMAGDRVTVRLFGEFASYETDDGDGSTEWTDVFFALPISYDRIERNQRIVEDSELFRLSLYAGPAISFVNGDISSPGINGDFKEKEALGVLAGMDIYFTRSVVLGAQAYLFDVKAEDISGRAALRYHF